MKRLISAIASSLLASAAWAQTAPHLLNLKLPPGDVPAASSTVAAAPAAASTTAPAASAIMTGSVPAVGSTVAPVNKTPGVYYGDTSGRMGNTTAAAAPACDDATYDKPQVHGSVSTGIYTGSHVGTGNYQSGTVNVNKRLGSCDDPQGDVNMSISVGTSHQNGRRRHDDRYGY